MRIQPSRAPIWTVENAQTHEIFEARIDRIMPGQRIMVGRPNFDFSWKAEISNPERQVFKLTTALNSSKISGLLSLTPQQGSICMNLLESARFNRSPNKQYLRVAGNLIAYACRLSYQMGNDGYVYFDAKTSLIDHYRQAYGATQFGRQLMAIEPAAAYRLLDYYHRGFLSEPS